MRILITNNTLASRAGSELYVRDIALGLLKRGHTPIVYSQIHGAVAQDLRAGTVATIDNLGALAVQPDVIHGQHHLETMTALLQFPGVPAISVCHGWLPWEETPPRFPRIRRYVAVDYTCRDRLVLEHGIAEEQVEVILNFVDLDRFKARPPLPARPRRALIFSNQATAEHIARVREAREGAGIALDVIGLAAGNVVARPEAVLGEYDIVFAKARAAIEGMAVGAAVILCDAARMGPMVTAQELDRLRPLNFGVRTLREPVTAAAIGRELARYDPHDAAEVSARIRATAGREAVIDRLVALYETVRAEQATLRPDMAAEERAAAAYIAWLAGRVKERDVMARQRDVLQAEYDRLQAQLAARAARLEDMEREAGVAIRAQMVVEDVRQAETRMTLEREAVLGELEAQLRAHERTIGELRAELDGVYRKKVWWVMRRYEGLRARLGHWGKRS